jgi:transposase
MQGKVSSEQNTSTGPVYAGIDVCKDWLDIHVHPLNRSLRLSNDASGIRQLKRLLTKLNPVCIVLEATGKYHRPAHRSLFADGFTVAIVDPYRARMFAKSCGYLAKTDRLDARLLALMGEALEPAASVPSAPAFEALQELVNARSAAIAELNMLANRIKATQTSVLKAALARLARNVQKHIDWLDAEIANRIAKDPDLCRKAEILTSIPGVGPVTAQALMAGLQELGQCTGKQAAMLAGLAPVANDSGARSGTRSIRAGRPAPRRALYMAALSASRCNPALSRFAKILKAAGKPPKVVLVAIMRKLLVLANTLLTQNRLWSPNAP